MSLVPAFRPRPSPLHTARAGATSALCAALALVCVLFTHPLVLLAAAAGVVAAGLRAGVGGEVARAARLAVPFALLVAVINPLVSQGGETLLVRGGSVLGQRIDITLEAIVAGGLAGLRVGALVMVCGLFSACVDPDELLRMFRRLSYRSALSAALATRLVPVLARDAARMSDAARCRPQPPRRLAVARAAVSGALERAVDVAAALEVRGYSCGGRARRRRRPFSRHDLRVSAAAALLAGTALAARVAGVGDVTEYPRFTAELGPGELALAVALPIISMLPFGGRGARLGVAVRA